jgi:hypothetical protein
MKDVEADTADREARGDEKKHDADELLIAVDKLNHETHS